MTQNTHRLKLYICLVVLIALNVINIRLTLDMRKCTCMYMRVHLFIF